MSTERDERQYPAVAHLRAALRVNLLRAAAHTCPPARSRFSRRQRVGVLAAIGLVTVPGGIALARLVESREVEYQCPSAAPAPDVQARVGVPVDSGAPVVEEPLGTAPENPCE